MIRRVAGKFAIDGTFLDAERCGSGHINQTFAAAFQTPGGIARFIVQRINDGIFTDVPALMQNVSRITRHLAGSSLTLVQSRSGEDYVVDDDQAFWRAYVFIEAARTVELPESPEQALEAARAFGRFDAALAGLPAPPLNETIAGFHDTRARFSALKRAIAADSAGRAANANSEIRFALAQESLTQALHAVREAGVPVQAVHNDAKISNVLLADDGAHRVIDLDTVMPGLRLLDAGELVRTAAASASEDEPDPRKMHVRPEYYRAIVRGFSEGCGGALTAHEQRHFNTAATVMAYENGIRFLADYLQGDTYFRVHRAGQNLDRARAQFALVRSLEADEEELAP